MKKNIWGKRKMALFLGALLFAESAAPVQALAGETGDITDLLSEEVTVDAVTDGDAQAPEDNIVTEDDSDNGSGESANDENANNEDVNNEDVNNESSNNENIASEDASDKALDENNSDSSDENAPSEEVSDGNAEQTDDEEAVSDGNADADACAFDYETVVDGYKIKLHAEEGIVPSGTEVTVKKVNKVNGEKTEDLVNDVLPEESAVYDSASFDITLSKDGVEFEPDGKVSVEIVLNDELSDVSSENDSVSLQVFHIEDDATTTEVDAEVKDEATNVYDGTEDTVISYDAESFSVYNVSAVANFTTSETVALENPAYEKFLSVSKEELANAGSELDPAAEVKTLFSQNGKCTSIQEMAEIARNAIKTRQNVVTLNFKMPGIYNEYNIYTELMPIMNEHTGVPNEGDYARWSYVIHAYKASTSFLNDATYGTFQLQFTYTDTPAQEAAAGQAITNLINQKGWQKLGSDKAKIDAVYNWIIANISYDRSYEYKDSVGNYFSHSCYSAIVTRQTVCQGYAMLFYRIMLSLGVDNRMISGLGYASQQNSGHAWNLVQLGNKYYYVDSTWDDDFYSAGYGKPYYLRGSRTNKYVTVNGKRYNTCFDSSEHVRYEECATADFLNVYPVSASDYTSAGSYVKATSVSISRTSATIGVGATMQLTASCAPANTSQRVKWNSSDPTVASVNAYGVVTGHKNGECEIFATSEYGGKKARCRLLVTDGKVKDIELATTKITVYAGSKAQISATVFPYWAANKGISYKSSKKSIASVSKDGVIRGKKPGKCTITCKAKDGGSTVKIKVTVKKAKRVKSVKLTKKKLKLSVGERYTLGVKFNPRKATNKEVTWKSSKPSVVYVDAGGNLVALRKGKAKITVKSDDGKHKATCTVKIK